MISSAEISTISDNGKKLPLMENFYTLQGEGFYQGHAAYFIRLGGCEVGCHWCDVKESWDFYKWPLKEVSEIVERAALNKGKIAVVTGGEPTHYNLQPLTNALHAENFRTHIETSGVFPITGNWDWLCFSPKKFKEPHPEVFQQAHELKIIVYSRADFQWAEKLASKVNPFCFLYLQPEWSRHQEMAPLIIQYIKENPRWRISVQVHKYLNIP